MPTCQEVHGERRTPGAELELELRIEIDEIEEEIDGRTRRPLSPRPGLGLGVGGRARRWRPASRERSGLLHGRGRIGTGGWTQAAELRHPRPVPAPVPDPAPTLRLSLWAYSSRPNQGAHLILALDAHDEEERGVPPVDDLVPSVLVEGALRDMHSARCVGRSARCGRAGRWHAAGAVAVRPASLFSRGTCG